MNKEFTHEARYVVLKNADIMQCLTINELIELRRIQARVKEHRTKIGKPRLDCVVVESDWPEYEPTWRAIEARLTGAQPSPSVPNGWKEAAIAWEVCASIHREYGKGKDPFFNTRQGDFVKHANDARAMLAAAPKQEAQPAPLDD